MRNHESYCTLKAEHYGPCSPTEREYYVTDDTGKVLWRLGRPEYGPDGGWSGDPESDFQTRYLPAERAAEQACIDAAFRLGYLPLVRHHSTYTDTVEWPIEVKEIEPYGDVLLTLPMGKYKLAARRARKGDTTSHVTTLFGGSAVGFGSVATEDMPEPVRVFGKVVRAGVLGEYWFQPSHFEYADGTVSGYLGSYPKDITKAVERML